MRGLHRRAHRRADTDPGPPRHRDLRPALAGLVRAGSAVAGPRTAGAAAHAPGQKPARMVPPVGCTVSARHGRACRGGLRVVPGLWAGRVYSTAAGTPAAACLCAGAMAPAEWCPLERCRERCSLMRLPYGATVRNGAAYGQHGMVSPAGGTAWCRRSAARHCRAGGGREPPAMAGGNGAACRQHLRERRFWSEARLVPGTVQPMGCTVSGGTISRLPSQACGGANAVGRCPPEWNDGQRTAVSIDAAARRGGATPWNGAWSVPARAHTPSARSGLLGDRAGTLKAAAANALRVHPGPQVAAGPDILVFGH